MCATCYTTYVRSKQECPQCNRVTLLVPTATGNRCRPCLGFPERFGCTVCGEEGSLFEQQTCARCVLKSKARELLSADAGIVEPHLLPLYELIVAAKQPRSVLKWLKEGISARALRQLVVERTISHATIDEIPSRLARDFLRAMVVSAGVLPTRSELSNRLESWLESYATRLPVSTAKLVKIYAQWHLLRRLRRKLERGMATRGTVGWFQQRVRIASHFIGWLATNGLTIATCTQPDIDLWLVESQVTTAYSVRDFLRWT